MNIILTIDFSPWSAYGGGAQRSTHNLALALSRRGHTVSVVYTRTPWEHFAYPDDLPYDVHWATFFDVRSRRRAPLRPLNAYSVARVVQHLLDDNQEQVVHANGEEGGMIAQLRPQHRFGFVATPRHPRYPVRLLHKAEHSPLAKAWLILREGKYLMQGRAARQADLCVPPSTYAANLLRHAFNLHPSKLRVIPNGIPDEFLSYDHDPCALGDGPIVFFGRFEDVKGIDTLIDAVRLLGKQSPRTIIIGQGSQKHALQQRIHKLGLDDQVSIAPWMNHEELAQTLTEARMVALPSRKENFSLAVLSAMAVGAPVISTSVGGTPEIIDHGKTGLLVEPDHPQALAAAISHLQNHPDVALRLGRAGRAYVRTHLTWDRVAESFEALYLQLPVFSQNRSYRIHSIPA